MYRLNTLSSGAAGFLVGGAIAAAVALLYAPRSGEQTRTEIKERAMLARWKANMAIEEAKERVLNAAEEVQDRAHNVIESVGQEAQHKAHRLKEIGSTVVEEQKTSLERGAYEAREALKS